MNSSNVRGILLAIFLVILINAGMNYFLRGSGQSAEISYSSFRSALAGNNQKKVTYKWIAASGAFLKQIKVHETVQGKVTIIPHGRLEALATALQEEETLDGARVGEILQLAPVKNDAKPGE